MLEKWKGEEEGKGGKGGGEGFLGKGIIVASSRLAVISFKNELGFFFFSKINLIFLYFSSLLLFFLLFPDKLVSRLPPSKQFDVIASFTPLKTEETEEEKERKVKGEKGKEKEEEEEEEEEEGGKGRFVTEEEVNGNVRWLGVGERDLREKAAPELFKMSKAKNGFFFFFSYFILTQLIFLSFSKKKVQGL